MSRHSIKIETKWTLALSPEEIEWRRKKFGCWTGTASIMWLRSECRYEWAKKTAITRFIFERIFPREIYSYIPDEKDPLTFHAPNGVCMTFAKMEFDQGSVPRFAQFFIEKDQYPRTFAGHDHIYEFNGAFFRRVDFPELDSEPSIDPELDWIPSEAMSFHIDWRFVKMTQKQADDFLYAGVGSENGLLLQRNLVYVPVSIFGYFVWSTYKGPTPTL